MTEENEHFLGELRLGRELTKTWHIIAVGLAIYLGLIFIYAEPVLNTTGSNAIYAIALTGIALGITLLNILELLGGSGERGGTYILIQEVLGGFGAFLAGWGILIGATALSALLIRESGIQFLLLTDLDGLAPILGVGILLLISLLQVFQVFPQRQRYPIFLVVVIISVLGMTLSALPGFSLDRIASTQPLTLGTILPPAAWLIVGFIGFEVILASRRQIQSPLKRLPPALTWTQVVGILFTFLLLWIIAGLANLKLTTTNLFTDRVTSSSFLPDWFIHLFVLLSTLISANILIITTTRQIHRFSQGGAFPKGLRRMYRGIPLPPGLYGILSIFTIPMILLGPTQWLLELTSAMLLVTLTILNISTIYSHRKEPERRRTFLIPFFPLIPSLGIGFNLILLFSLPINALLNGAICLGIGILIYFTYAKGGQTAAQVGDFVFGPTRVTDRKTKYRVLVPIGEGDERHLVLDIAVSLTLQMDGDIIALQVIKVPDPLAIEEGRRVAKERNTLFKWSTKIGRQAGVKIFPITRLSRSAFEGIIDTATEEHCDLILLSWDVTSRRARGQLGTVLDNVIRLAPCDLAVLAYHPENIQRYQTPDIKITRTRRVLVPTAGGPHAPLATQLALLLTREQGAVVEAVYIVPTDASPADYKDGNQRIQQTFDALRDQEAELIQKFPNFLKEVQIEGEVIPANGVVAGITKAGEDCDLILIGATEESLIDQVLFGNIPEQVARQSSTPVLMVKRFRGLRRFWIQRIWRTLFETLPTITNEQQIDVYRTLHRGARPSVDYFVLIGLSTLIATFGLLQNNTAVIIGAMLVAPLFTPLMALSLAIVQGNVRLLRLGIESMLKGVAVAIALAIFITAISPATQITGEIAARTEPNLLDLGVAIAAGIVGAYAIARKEVAAALPGVAIAAALVPPLGVVGIGLGTSNLTIAAGAGLLVATNLIAIQTAGAVTLLMLGFRPTRGSRRENWRRALFSALVLFLVITISLLTVSIQSFRTSQISDTIQDHLQNRLNNNSSIALANLDNVQIQSQDDRIEVTVPVYLKEEIQPEIAQTLSDELSQAVGSPVWVRLVVLTVIEPP